MGSDRVVRQWNTGRKNPCKLIFAGAAPAAERAGKHAALHSCAGARALVKPIVGERLSVAANRKRPDADALGLDNDHAAVVEVVLDRRQIRKQERGLAVRAPLGTVAEKND